MSRVGSTPPSQRSTAAISVTVEEKRDLIGSLDFWMIRSCVLESYAGNLDSTWKWMHLPLSAPHLGHPELCIVKLAKCPSTFFCQPTTDSHLHNGLTYGIKTSTQSTVAVIFFYIISLCLALFKHLVCLWCLYTFINFYHCCLVPSPPTAASS